MKYLVLAFCVLCISAAWGADRCHNGDDCAEGECCVNYLLLPMLRGWCKKLAEEDEFCHPMEKIGEKEDKYHYACPCKKGLECEAELEFEIFGHNIKHKPKCVAPDVEPTEGDGDVETPAEDF